MKYFLMVCVCLFSVAQAHGFDFQQELNNAQKLRDELQAKQVAVQTPLKTLGITDYSEPEEIAIGRQISGNLLGAAPLVKDAALQRYVNKVGHWVASQSERAELTWHFGVIESSDINAFAAPGGYIFITRGLYQMLANEGELAGVLGHEIAHVLRRHHLKILQQSNLLDLGSKAVSQQIGGNEKIATLICSGAEIMSRGLDKDAEFEADRIGVVLTARAGYDGYTLTQVLQQIGHTTASDDSVALLFKTHPHPDARLEKLAQAMDSRFDAAFTSPKRLYKLK